MYSNTDKLAIWSRTWRIPIAILMNLNAKILRLEDPFANQSRVFTNFSFNHSQGLHKIRSTKVCIQVCDRYMWPLSISCKEPAMSVLKDVQVFCHAGLQMRTRDRTLMYHIDPVQ